MYDGDMIYDKSGVVELSNRLLRSALGTAVTLLYCSNGPTDYDISICLSMVAPTIVIFTQLC